LLREGNGVSGLPRPGGRQKRSYPFGGSGGGVQFSALTAAIVVSMELYFSATRGRSEHGIFFSCYCLSACGLLALATNLGIGGGQTGLGLDSGRFFFFDRLFASLLVLRSAHGVLGGSHYSAFFLIRFASARSFLLFTASSFYCALRLLARLREEPPNIFVVALVQLAILANFIRPEPPLA
jgi:hypothetical protein